MSLILEALRKLEREKPTPERASTVLLAPLAWPNAQRRRWLGAAAVTASVLLALSAVWWSLGRAPRAAIPATPPTPAPAAGASRATPPLSAPTPEQTAANSRVARAGATVQRATPARDASPAASPSDFRLTVIGDQEGVPVAVINDRLVRVGDVLHGARVLKITATAVELEREADGTRITLGF